jgi:hypothetical protein
MFAILDKYVIRYSYYLQSPNVETCFLEGFALGTGGKIFALVKMSAREGPFAYRGTTASQRVFSSRWHALSNSNTKVQSSTNVSHT